MTNLKKKLKMRRKRNNIIIVVTTLLVISILIWQNFQINKLTNDLKEEKVKSEAEIYKTEVITRQLNRQANDQIYAYRDSIRQATIDEILESNKSLNLKVKQQIKKLKDSPNSYRDSLWIEEWKKVDGPLFDNQ